MREAIRFYYWSFRAWLVAISPNLWWKFYCWLRPEVCEEAAKSVRAVINRAIAEHRKKEQANDAAEG